MKPAQPVSGPVAELLRASPICRSWAEQEQGPYHRDTPPARRDIIEDRSGAALQLGIRLVNDDDSPVADAQVEIWHCDALGRYSGFPPPNLSVASPTGPPGAEYLTDATFLRGSQPSDATGAVEFHTVYPGWYPGRTVHIHIMVHLPVATATSQLYFPDHINDHVLATAPYSQRPGRDTTNDTDTIFSTGGTPAVLEVIPAPGGYRAAACLVIAPPTGTSGGK